MIVWIKGSKHIYCRGRHTMQYPPLGGFAGVADMALGHRWLAPVTYRGEMGRDPNFPSWGGGVVDSSTEYVYGIWVNSATAGQPPSVPELFYTVTRSFNIDKNRLHNDYRRRISTGIIGRHKTYFQFLVLELSVKWLNLYNFTIRKLQFYII